jgi:hypothetical protein
MPRRDLRVVKLAEFLRAKWMIARGMPVAHIALRLRVSPVTVRAWRKLGNHNHAYTQLRRQVLALPESMRDQLLTDLVGATARQQS